MEHNTVVNRYLSDNERYADLINGCQFGGKQVITAGDLHDLDTQVNAAMGGTPSPDTDAFTATGASTKGNTSLGGTTKKKPNNRKTKYRDLIRKLAFGVNFMVIGLENQEEVHYLMPLRTMEYDVREYQRQAAVIRKRPVKERR